MPGHGTISGKCVLLKFEVQDKQGNEKARWHEHDHDTLIGAGQIRIELLKEFSMSGNVITVPLQSGPCVDITWGYPRRQKKRRRR